MIRRYRYAFLLCLFCLALLGLAGCRTASSSAEVNAVTAVISDGEGMLRIEAALTESFLREYEGKNVYLFELPSAYTMDADLRSLDPIAHCKADGSLSFSCTAYDGVRSRLFSSFLLASYDGDTQTYTAITTPLAVSDFATEETAPDEKAEVSIKGVISDSPYDAVLLGAAHTVVDVHMDELILENWQEGAVPYIWNGLTAYVDGEALARLDKQISAYTGMDDIRVYLRFLLRTPAEEQTNIPLCLYLPTDGEAEGSSYRAVNMGDSRAADIMEGFLNFMADRYASPEDGSRPVENFVMGYRVNCADPYNGGGSMDLAEYVRNYEKLMRVAHVALRSHSAGGCVYISLDSCRTGEAAARGRWDIPAFLSAFNGECELLGNFDWRVACELYVDPTRSDIWVEDAKRDSAYYTVHSLRNLTDLLASDQYRTPDGENRGVMISGFAVPALDGSGDPSEEGEILQAAAYAYAYLTCAQNPGVEALIYSSYADGSAEDVCGIWKAEETEDGLRISGKRRLYEVFRQMDTAGAAMLSEDIAAVVGDAYVHLELSMAGKLPPVTVVAGGAERRDFESEHPRSEEVLLFNRGTLHGFEGIGSLLHMELVSAETLGTINLHGCFDPSESAVNQPMGMQVILPASDILGGKKLLLDLYAGGEDASVKASRITLRLTRFSKGSTGDGDGEILYEASVGDIRDGVWHTLAFDVGGFTTLLDSDDEVSMMLLMDYGGGASDCSSAYLGLAGVYVSGNAAAAKHSTGLVIGVVAALSVVVIGVFVFLLIRYRRRR
ncbi:MAG: hypothetical protein E7610_06340 [Ruminococcaceae bacterium]|nr:hypothetical protein [Oscillospiraceae bacterium]